ncbi:hypothetical protein SAMN05216474_0344 [Lishizhenia tianjinensis]|uniref:Uncharacterized protein n=1 Tax=Lishizhenia tianjinensis TaxID=477690 RepID=A0A1I6XQD4_9FLAO|nr:hypothetical protein [Lishizhenia tianjinensis]SFT39934.1 hypothetical protein SAMN05216474_0344 [Lishizhenia tianjinensis]
MKGILALFIVALTSSLILGCKKDTVDTKDENDNLFVANVHVYDSLTGDAVKAKVDFIWVAPGGGGWLSHEVLHTVETNAQGIAQLESVVPDQYIGLGGDFVLRIQRSGYFNVYGQPNDDRFGKVLPVSIDSEVNIDLALNPFYSIILSAENVNCSAATDSVWIEAVGTTYEYEAYGCADTTYPGIFHAGDMENITCVYDTNYAVFQITTKKSGVVNTYTESHGLTLGNTPDQIHISY